MKSDLDIQRRIWRERLEDSGCSPEEAERCLMWLEELTLNSILAGWFVQGRISLRWDGLKNEPLFEVK